MANPTTSTKNRPDDGPGTTGFQGGTGHVNMNTGSNAGNVNVGQGTGSGDTGGGFGERVRDAASAVADKARDAASSLTERAGDVASGIGSSVTGATSTVGGGMKSLAETIREHVPNTGMLGGAGSTVADSLERGGRYLEEEGFSGIGEDLTGIIRRNPIPAMLCGIAVGFLLARATTSNRS